VTDVFNSKRPSPALKIIDVTGIFCSNDICPVGTAEQSLYYDAGHLTAVGSLKIVDFLTAALRDPDTQ